MQLWLDVPPHPSIAIGTGWLEALQAHLLAALASACSRCATGGNNSTVLAQAGSSAPAAGGDKAAIIAAVVQAMKLATRVDHYVRSRAHVLQAGTSVPAVGGDMMAVIAAVVDAAKADMAADRKTPALKALQVSSRTPCSSSSVCLHSGVLRRLIPTLSICAGCRFCCSGQQMQIAWLWRRAGHAAKTVQGHVSTTCVAAVMRDAAASQLLCAPIWLKAARKRSGTN